MEIDRVIALLAVALIAIIAIAYRIGVLHGGRRYSGLIVQGFLARLGKPDALVDSRSAVVAGDHILKDTLGVGHASNPEREINALTLGERLHWAAFEDGRHYQANVGILPPDP